MHDTRLAVYVPNDDAPELLKAAVARIDRGSGIVGSEPTTGDRILIFFEGNRFGAQNMVTFADRCYFAGSRLLDDYPTVAQAYVPAGALKQAGWYYPHYGRVEIRDVHDMIALAHWLDLEVGDDRLQRELRFAGVRSHG